MPARCRSKMALCGEMKSLARSYSRRARFARRRERKGTMRLGNRMDLLTSRSMDLRLYSTRSSLSSTSP